MYEELHGLTGQEAWDTHDEGSVCRSADHAHLVGPGGAERELPVGKDFELGVVDWGCSQDEASAAPRLLQVPRALGLVGALVMATIVQSTRQGMPAEEIEHHEVQLEQELEQHKVY